MSKIGPAVSEKIAQFCFCELIVTVCGVEMVGELSGGVKTKDVGNEKVTTIKLN